MSRSSLLGREAEASQSNNCLVHKGEGVAALWHVVRCVRSNVLIGRWPWGSTRRSDLSGERRCGKHVIGPLHMTALLLTHTSSTPSPYLDSGGVLL